MIPKELREQLTQCLSGDLILYCMRDFQGDYAVVTTFSGFAEEFTGEIRMHLLNPWRAKDETHCWGGLGSGKGILHRSTVGTLLSIQKLTPSQFEALWNLYEDTKR